MSLLSVNDFHHTASAHAVALSCQSPTCADGHNSRIVPTDDHDSAVGSVDAGIGASGSALVEVLHGRVSPTTPAIRILIGAPLSEQIPVHRLEAAHEGLSTRVLR